MKRIVYFTIMLFVLFAPNVYALDLSAECAYLIIADSGECLYDKNGSMMHSIASTTKIMTAITAIENSNMQEVVTVSANAASQEGSSIYLRTGNKVNLKDLICGMLINSGNDAACAVAEHVGGSIEDFANMMNDKAKELGANDSSFKNPSGLDQEGHYSTAADLAKIAAYSMTNETFREIVSTKNQQINVDSDICYLKNHNKLLWNYEGCTGIKTGYTKRTGRCLVSAAEKDGIELIAVTLDAPDDWNDHKKMLDYGFSNTELKQPVKKGDILKTFEFDNYSFNAVANDTVTVAKKKNSPLKADVILHTIKEPTVQIEEGEKVGYLECIVDGKKIKEVDLISDRRVEMIEENKDNFISFFWKKLKNMLRRR